LSAREIDLNTAHKETGDTMFNGFISLRVKDPKRVAEWYTKHRILELMGGREDIGSQALGSREHGYALILLPGDAGTQTQSVQLHFHVKDVDAEYKRLSGEDVAFEEPPKNMPWAGAMRIQKTRRDTQLNCVLHYRKRM
jgi:hypothetical protein